MYHVVVITLTWTVRQVFKIAIFMPLIDFNFFAYNFMDYKF